MHAYVINLARSLDRRAHITSELKKTELDYEIITAVDGRELDLDDLLDRKIIDPGLATLTNFLGGTTGAALSHQSVYRRIIADGLDEALVLEDDVTLPADVASLAETVAAYLDGAEVALLSYDTFEPCKLSREGSIHLSPTHKLALPIDVGQPRSGGGYIITRAACERMIENVPPVRVNPDDWWFFYREGILDRVRCVAPGPVHKHGKLASTLGSYALGNSLRGRLVYPLVRRRIPVLHQVLAYRRQRILDLWDRSEFVDMAFIEKPSRLD